uniref:Seipin n=1 Tax=Kalanchoe fedtschenkoi TaxID=63787 RepID=A0A7N0TYZ5_KALFE
MPAKSTKSKRHTATEIAAGMPSRARDKFRRGNGTKKDGGARLSHECPQCNITSRDVNSMLKQINMKRPESTCSESGALVDSNVEIAPPHETPKGRLKRWSFRINHHLTLIPPHTMRRRPLFRKQPPFIPTPPPAPPPTMASAIGSNIIPKPPEWLQTLITFQADIIFYCLSTLLAPFLSLISLILESYHQAEQTKESVESAAAKVPSSITHGSMVLLRKLGLGLLGVAYVCMVLFVVLVLAALVGIGFVQLWVEEPVLMKEKLHFDYTAVNPQAVFSFHGGDFEGHTKVATNKKLGMPAGHTFYVSLVMLMPESDYNREIGVFQLAAELLSVEGNVVKSSSQPCMLRFRSLPIRLTRTLAMGVPLLLGFSSETQVIALEILRHKEGSPRSGAIRVTLIPRAGTSYLPQLYEAEIVVNSYLPWNKELVRSWKWTLYVWASILSDRDATDSGESAIEMPTEQIEQGEEIKDEDDRRISEAYRRWQRHRNKRKAILMQGMFTDTSTFESSASSICFSREDSPEEELWDSDSVCYGG